jgi:molybdopterin converting factor subunit 1
MIVHVQLFARARDLAGTSRLTVELPEMATVGDLRRRLGEMMPQAVRLLELSAIAVDDELATDAQHLDSRSEIALLPPVSGG